MLTDAPDDVGRLHAAMNLALPIEKKLAAIDSMVRSGRELADLGLRLRKPNASHRELLENWLALTLPPELFEAVRRTAVDTPETAIGEVRHLARLLRQMAIEVSIGGSVASSIYSNPRHTQDVDISVQSFEGREDQFVGILDAEYFVSKVSVLSALRRKSTFNLLRKKLPFKIDVFIQQDRPYDLAAWDRRRPLPPEFAGDVTVYVHSAEDIVLQKLGWYRLGNEISEKQWSDIVGVVRSQAATIDQDYIGLWSRELKVADLWERAKQETGL